MLDLVADSFRETDSKFLEPGCGNGNFLVAILERKLNLVSSIYTKQMAYEYNSLIALASIYGIDIDPANIQESRQRMYAHLLDSYSYRLNTVRPTDGYLRAVDYVLDRNIVQGDFLNGTNDILLTEFSTSRKNMFEQRLFRLSDLLISEGSLSLDATPVLVIEQKYYWALAEK